MIEFQEEVSFEYRDLQLSEKEIEDTLGYKKNTAPEHFRKMIDEVISKLSSLLNLRCGYSIQELQNYDRKDGLYIGGKFFKMEKLITSHLKKSEQAAILVCTIGPGIENWSKQLHKEGDMAKSYIADTTASIIVDKLADLLSDNIKVKMRKENLNVTNRYSPGYCGWSVSDQHLLFSLLPEKFCGVLLTDSALMIPIKSISGVIGIGSNVVWKEYNCEKCNVADCSHRNYAKRNKN